LYATYIKEGIPFIRVQNLTSDGRILLEDAVCVTPFFHKKMKKSVIQYNDILLTVTGATVGKVAISKYKNKEFNINQNIAKIRINEKVVVPDFVYLFLKSKIGQIQLYRNAQRSAQEYLSYGSIESIFITYPEDKNTQKDIVNKVKKFEEIANDKLLEYEKYRKLSREKFLEILLGFNTIDKKFKHSKKYTLKSKETINTRRLDFEWNHPRHKQLQKQMEKLAVHENLELSSLKSICYPYLGSEPSQYTNEGIPIIKIRNLKDGEIDLEDDIDLTLPLFISNFEKQKLKRYDILTPSRGVGSIGKVDIFDADNNMLILRANKEEIDPWYLLYFLRSGLGQIQIERYTTGSTGQIQLTLRDARKISILYPKEIDDQIAISKGIRELELKALSSRNEHYENIKKAENVFLEFILGDKAKIAQGISIRN